MSPQPSDPLDFSNKYNTPIPPEKQKLFDQWAVAQKQKTGKDPRGDRYDYDVNGDWLSGSATDSRGHGSDQFKKPNHPTFSDQSQYNGLDGYVGGSWVDPSTGSPNGAYKPSQTNIQFHGQDGLQDYFKKVEPGTALLPPEPVPTPTGSGGIYTIKDLTGQTQQSNQSYPRYNSGRLQ